MRLPDPDRRRVTVILPTYNRAESLERCLRALLACETDGREVTVRVVDDGSRDRTRAVVEALQASCPPGVRLHYHRQENAGQSAARNRAIAAADTDLLLCIDDDCESDRGWLRALVEGPWEPDVAALGGRVAVPEARNWVSRYCRHIRYNEYPSQPDPEPFVNTASCAFRRQAVLEVGGFRTEVSGGGEDYDLCRRLTAAGYRLAYQLDAVIHHHHRESLRDLLRTTWKRGYARTLRYVWWGERPAPTPRGLRRQYRLLLQAALRVVVLPARAWTLHREGVPAGDALPFAFLVWARQMADRCGRIAMTRRLLAGREPLPTAPGAAGGAAPGGEEAED